jgi:hypothetical protein
MQAVEQWRAIEADLGGAWDEVDLAFTVEDRAAVSGAAAVLGPLGAGRSGNVLRVHVSNRAGGREKLLNLLGRLDRKRAWGTLELVDAKVPAPPEPDDAFTPEELTPAGVSTTALLANWDAATALLPPGWTDLLCELELESTDLLARAALLGAPLNPTRVPGAIALRFRVSSGGGYGASAGMVRRCLERMEADGIRGRVRALETLSDAEYVGTQGPVWRIAGRSV